MKKIRGTIYYFGRWGTIVDGRLVRVEGDGWEEALRLYKAQADDLHAGREPRRESEGSLTVKALCDRFYTVKKKAVEAGELGRRSLEEYDKCCARLVKSVGRARLVSNLAPDDFERLRNSLAKRYGPVRLANEIQKIRTLFKYAYDSGLIDKPVRFGPTFKKPSAAVMRRHRAKAGPKMLEAREVRTLIEAAPNATVKAMIFLAINCGFGNHDLATLPLSALKLDDGWVDFPRPKTGIARRCKLWPETVQAIRESLDSRPRCRQAGSEKLAFLTTRGRQWISRDQAHPVSVVFIKLMTALGMHRPGIGPYTLRHVFRTIGDRAKDPVACDLIMGHSDSSMAARYRESIDDDRIEAVVEIVRQWLFGDDKPQQEEKPASRLRVVG